MKKLILVLGIIVTIIFVRMLIKGMNSDNKHHPES